ncbi:hypothetical protein GCM10022221_05660 [Actinocorallia aurea]
MDGFGAELLGHRADVGAQSGEPVGRGVVGGAWALVLPAHVHGDDTPARTRQRLQNSEEILFTPGVSGYQKRRLTLGLSDREGFEHGELAARRPQGRTANDGGQFQEPGRAHGDSTYQPGGALRVPEREGVGVGHVRRVR